MSAKKLVKTTFGNSPKKGMEVIDIYKEESVQKFISNPNDATGVAVLNDVYPGLKADKVMEVLKDPRTKAYLDQTGMSINQLIQQTQDLLPGGVNLNDLMGGLSFPGGFSLSGGLGGAFDFVSGMDWPAWAQWPEGWKLDMGFSLPECFEFAKSLKDSISLPEWLKLDTGMISTIFKKAKELYRQFNIGGLGDNGILGWGLAQVSGMLSGQNAYLDFIMGAAHKYGVANKLIELGVADKVLDWITGNTDIPDSIKDIILGDLAKDAAEAGNGDLSDSLLDAAGGGKTHQRREILRATLRGYRFPTGIQPNGYPAEATKFIARLDKIESTWDTATRDTDTVKGLSNFRFASEHALRLFFHHDRTRGSALLYHQLRPAVVSYRSLATQNYPYLSL